MKHQRKRPVGLLAIVAYKFFVAVLLLATAIFLLFSVNNSQAIVVFSESYVLEGKLEIIEWPFEQITKIKPQTLQLSGIGAGLYAVVTAIEAVGLWYTQTWAMLLVIGLVGISIPAEIFELIRGITLLKLMIFLVNVAVFWYLLRHLPKPKR